MSRIVKTFMGEYIDLDKIISISDAFIDPQYYFSAIHYHVSFCIDIQLLERPLIYTRLLTTEEFYHIGYSGHYNTTWDYYTAYSGENAKNTKEKELYKEKQLSHFSKLVNDGILSKDEKDWILNMHQKDNISVNRISLSNGESVLMVDNDPYKPWKYEDTLAVYNLQSQIDELAEQWKNNG